MSKYGLRHDSLKKLFKVIGVLSIVLSILFIFYLVKDLDIFHNPKVLSQMIKDHLFWGSLVFFCLQIFQVIAPIVPGGVTTVVGFLTFGPLLGFALNVIGIVLGSVFLFLLVRVYGKPFIALFIDDKKIRDYEKKLATKTYERFFIMNMASPMAPADIMIMITGLSQISFRRFLMIIIICRPISILTYSYFWIYGGKLLGHLF
ncbi:membrane protein [Streptococcus pseudoporcinus]|uniref:TVP38/TMEM64 family membrane protein n=1 Tax=Streptococcus pseudoporcinus TaxID=361101 RepID=A0A4V6Z3X3_9STRE|nr:VTT domain-containing protein [Streptococcus pseudoporcinus]VTS21607.1 membrane protein [Streptococcus pseudoporcinus]